jgi:hypothetical protein
MISFHQIVIVKFTLTSLKLIASSQEKYFLFILKHLRELKLDKL